MLLRTTIWVEFEKYVNFKKKFIKNISGLVKISEGKSFGFVEDVFIHPSLVKKYQLTNGIEYSGKALKSYNKEKKCWTWKML